MKSRKAAGFSGLVVELIKTVLAEFIGSPVLRLF